MSNYVDQITLNGVTKIIRDTTLESKTAEQNGEDVSLVTTGEKYAWNHKGDGAVTNVVMNNSPVSINNGTLDLGTVITAHQDISGKLNSSLKGVANGLAELDANGKIPSAQLPSYVDDVLEYAGTSNFPATGESDKIYVDTTTNKTYRWSGSAYTIIGSDLALGETSSTAYRGDRGKDAYNHATDANKVSAASSSGLYKIAVTSEGHIASVTSVSKSDIVSLGIADSPVTDVQINSTSIVNQGVVNIPWATASTAGVVKVNALFGTSMRSDPNQDTIMISKATADTIKSGQQSYQPIVPSYQHYAVFYGLAKAAGDATQEATSVTPSTEIGTYTDDAKTAIRTMLGAGTYNKPSGGIPATDLVDGLLDGKSDIDIVTDEFDEEEPYNQGEYCYQNGKIYRAKSDLAAGSWDSSDWYEVNIMSEIVARSAIIPAAGVYF